jgi:hypothetical protein
MGVEGSVGGGGGISILRKFGKKEILFAAVTFVTSVLWAPPGFCFCVDTIRARKWVERERWKLYKGKKKEKAKDKLLFFYFVHILFNVPL